MKSSKRCFVYLCFLFVLKYTKEVFSEQSTLTLEYVPTTSTSEPESKSSPENEPESVSSQETTPEGTFSAEPKPEVTSSPETEPEVTSSPEAEPEVTSSPETEPEVTSSPETEPEASSSPKTEPKVTSSSETEPEASSSETEPEVTSSPETEPEASSPETEPEVTSTPETEPEAEPKVTSSPETEPEVTFSLETEPEASSSPEVEPEVTSSPETEPEVTSSPETEPEVTSSPETEQEGTSSPETEPEVTSSPETEPEASSSPEAEPEASSSPEAEPEVTSSPETEPEGTSSPETEPEASSSPEAEPEATSSPETEPEGTSSPETEPEASSSPEAEPEATSSPETEPEGTSSPETEPEVSSSPEVEPEVTSSPEAEPEVSSSPETEPEVSSSPEVEPEVTSLPEAEPEVSSSPETEPEVTSSPETEPEIISVPETEPEVRPTATEIVIPPFALILVIGFAGLVLFLNSHCNRFLILLKRLTPKKDEKIDSTVTLCDFEDTHDYLKEDSFYSDFDREVIESLRTSHNRPLDLFIIALPAILSLALCPITLYLYFPLVNFLWPPEEFATAPDINDAVACFLAPAGLVYATSFGFAFQQALSKQHHILEKVTSEISMVDQIATFSTKMTLSRPSIRRQIYRAVKAEAIFMILQLLNREPSSYKNKPTEDIKVKIWSIVDLLRQVDAGPKCHVDRILCEKILSHIMKLNSICSDRIGVLHSKIHPVKWAFLESLGFFSFIGILLLRAYSYRMELVMCVITVFSISMLCYVVSDLDSPFSGFFRVDLSVLSQVLQKLENMYSESLMEELEHTVSGKTDMIVKPSDKMFMMKKMGYPVQRNGWCKEESCV